MEMVWEERNARECVNGSEPIKFEHVYIFARSANASVMILTAEDIV